MKVDMAMAEAEMIAFVRVWFIDQPLETGGMGMR